MSLFGSIFMLSGLHLFTQRVDDDVIDRLHYQMTTNILIALTIVVSFKQFGGKPIECIIPEQVEGDGTQEYVENYCWSKNTYFVAFTEYVPDLEGREERQLSYYQWVPFFLLAQALSFQLPCIYWKAMAGHSGIKIHSIVQEATDPKNLQPAVRAETIRLLTVHVENALRFHRRLQRRQVVPHPFLRFLNLPYTAAYVTATYLIAKAMYLINSVAQFHLLNVFLQTHSSYDLYGWGALRDILNGTAWETSGVFPLITLCDFQNRAMGNMQRFTIQCVLTINIFTEKIFVFLWFWYSVIMVLSALSLIYWVFVTMCPCFARWFVKRHLELADMPFDAKQSGGDVDRFVGKYMRVDGMFAVRMITMHAGVIFGTDLLASLWRRYWGFEHGDPDQPPPPPPPIVRLSATVTPPQSDGDDPSIPDDDDAPTDGAVPLRRGSSSKRRSVKLLDFRRRQRRSTLSHLRSIARRLAQVE